MQYKRNLGFSIILAMGIALLSSVLILYLLEYMIPFSRNVKGIENSTNAYYHAQTAIEDSLFFINTHGVGLESSSGNLSSDGFHYIIIATGSVLPSPGFGNSDFDTDWSKLSTGKPVQIFLPSVPINWNNVSLSLRVPDFYSGTSLSIINTIPVVNWQITSSGSVLNSENEGARFGSGNICASIGSCTNLGMNKNGLLLNNTPQTIEQFTNINCGISGKPCILKLSVLEDLLATGNRAIPYIEYKISFGGVNVPSNIIQVNASGRSFGFQRNYTIFFRQSSLLEAYDFTIFQ